MASATLAPYKTNAATQSFTLVSSGTTGATWKATGRDLSTPYVISVERKLSTSTSTTNDHIVVRIARTERNTTTSKLATCQVLLDVSIPKDTSVLTAAVQKEILSCVSSLLNENTAMEATSVNITALIEGRDL
jgi:hypothetical protein